MRCQQAPCRVQDRGFVSSPACWEGGLLVAPGSRADDGYPPSGVKPEVSSATDECSTDVGASAAA